MAQFPSDLRMVACVLAVISMGSVTALGQSAAIQHGAAANREYAAVFAHSDNPCSAEDATTPYLQCMSKELAFIDQHLDAFVDDLRGVTASPKELAALNQTDATWRAYRETSCALPFKRGPGTASGPMSADCELSLDRAYMTQLSGMYFLSQFPK